MGNGAVDVFGVIGAHIAFQAVLLLAVAALFALATGVHQAAHAHAVAHFELGDLIAHSFHNAGDLMAHRQGEVGLAPLVADRVNIGVANTCSLDINDHIVFARIAALDFYDIEWCFRAFFLQYFALNCHAHDPTRNPTDLA